MTGDRRGETPDRREGAATPPPDGVERRHAEGDRRGAKPAPPRRDDLAGTGRSGLTPEAAMRARDVDRPTADDLARAETQLKIVRRNWTPPA